MHVLRSLVHIICSLVSMRFLPAFFSRFNPRKCRHLNKGINNILMIITAIIYVTWSFFSHLFYFCMLFWFWLCLESQSIVLAFVHSTQQFVYQLFVLSNWSDFYGNIYKWFNFFHILTLVSISKSSVFVFAIDDKAHTSFFRIRKTLSARFPRTASDSDCVRDQSVHYQLKQSAYNCFERRKHSEQGLLSTVWYSVMYLLLALFAVLELKLDKMSEWNSNLVKQQTEVKKFRKFSQNMHLFYVSQLGERCWFE